MQRVRVTTVATDTKKIRSLLIVVGVGVAANNIKVFIFVMEMQQLVPFVLLSSYKLFRVYNNMY